MAKTFDEQECLALINGPGDEDGPLSAYSLIIIHRDDLERKFKKVDKALRDFLADAKKTFPDAQYYTASGGFHLMLGRSHDDKERGQQELVALSGSAQIGDGDF